MGKLPGNLSDCCEHGASSESEIFIVEGESGAKAVCRARSPRNQAVLPMQGKPLNAMKHSMNDVLKNPHLSGVLSSLGVSIDKDFDINNLRYNKIILLMDPDADGVHCGTLMLLFFYRWLRPILDDGRLFMAYPPVWQMTLGEESVYLRSTDQYHRYRRELELKGVTEIQARRFRGVGGMSSEVLFEYCVDPDTRRIGQLSCKDAEMAIEMFAAMRAMPLKSRDEG